MAEKNRHFSVWRIANGKNFLIPWGKNWQKKNAVKFRAYKVLY